MLIPRWSSLAMAAAVVLSAVLFAPPSAVHEAAALYSVTGVNLLANPGFEANSGLYGCSAESWTPNVCGQWATTAWHNGGVGNAWSWYQHDCVTCGVSNISQQVSVVPGTWYRAFVTADVVSLSLGGPALVVEWRDANGLAIQPSILVHATRLGVQQLDTTAIRAPSGAAAALLVLTEDVAGASSAYFDDALFAQVTPPSVPGAPTNLQASYDVVGSIHLSWDAPSTNGAAILAYVVYQLTGTGYTAVGLSSGTYYDSPQPLGASTWFSVSAVNVAGEGPRSATTYGQAVSKLASSQLGVVNPQFDSGLEGWALDCTATGASITGDSAAGFSAAHVFTPAAKTGFCLIHQGVPLPRSGATYYYVVAGGIVTQYSPTILLSLEAIDELGTPYAYAESRPLPGGQYGGLPMELIVPAISGATIGSVSVGTDRLGAQAAEFYADYVFVGEGHTQ